MKGRAGEAPYCVPSSLTWPEVAGTLARAFKLLQKPDLRWPGHPSSFNQGSQRSLELAEMLRNEIKTVEPLAIEEGVH